MKPEFHEDFISEHADPIAEPYYDFNWDEIYTLLGEATDQDIQLRARVAVAFRRIFQWVLNSNINNKNAAQYIGRRTIALAWVMNPELFEGKSLTALATALGIDKQSLSKLASSASRKFTIENRGQAHGWNRGLKASKHAHNQLTASLSSPDPSPTTPPVAMFHNETPSRVKESFNDVEAGQVRQQHPTHLPS